ncbi:hypothetical protein [Luethyella okanaganae]|uniref:Uncharacterized protein n=1 Tax=Luethyella okanaganae TaxID=69372 RepID=A0ABW1VEC9_9MICO
MIPELRVSAAQVGQVTADVDAAAATTRDATVQQQSPGALGSTAVEAALAESSRLRQLRGTVVGSQLELLASGARTFVAELQSADGRLAASVR